MMTRMGSLTATLTHLTERPVSRRSVLKLLGAGAALPISMSLLAACGEEDPSGEPADVPDDEDDDVDEPEPADTDDDDEAETPEADTGEPQQGGLLNLALAGEPDALDPARTIQLNASSVNAHIYDRLIFITEERTPAPWVAEDWETSEDGTELTFHLRAGLTFHDGTDLNAEAVKFSFDRILDPDTASPARGQVGTLEEVEVMDDLSALFRFSEPYAPFFTNMSISYGGIVSPAGVEEHGDAFGRNPVGSGPFRFAEWSTGQHILLERFEGYENFRGDDSNPGAPYVDQMMIRFISEASTRVAALQSGELHVSDIERSQVPNIEADSNFRTIIWEDATNHNFLEFVDREPFNELAFKRAINHSIDRETIVASAYNGYASPNLLPMPTGLAGWDAQIGLEHGYPFDLERAQEILAEDGWEPGQDGILTKGDHRLDFTLLIYSGNEYIRISSEILQATWRTMGMDVDIQVMEFGAMQSVIEAGQHDVNWMRWTWPDPVILSLLFECPGWVGQYCDEELDELLNDADTEMDPDARIEKVQIALTHLLENAVVAPICTDWIISATRAEVHGYRWDALGGARFVDVWLEQ